MLFWYDIHMICVSSLNHFNCYSYCNFFFNTHRMMVSQLTAAGSHSHFARLFQKQLIQVSHNGWLFSHFFLSSVWLFYIISVSSLDVQRPLCARLLQWCPWCWFARHAGSRQPGSSEAPAAASGPASRTHWSLPSTILSWSSGVLQVLPSNSQLVNVFVIGLEFFEVWVLFNFLLTFFVETEVRRTNQSAYLFV